MTWGDGRPKHKRIIVWNDLHWFLGWTRGLDRPCERCHINVPRHSIAYRLLSHGARMDHENDHLRKRATLTKKIRGSPIRPVLCRPCGDTTEEISPAEVMTLKKAWYRRKAPAGSAYRKSLHRWQALIPVAMGRQAKRVNLGTYSSRENALIALENARHLYFPELMTPPPDENFYDAIDEEYEQ